MTAAQVQELRDSGQLIKLPDKVGFFIGRKPSSSEPDAATRNARNSSSTPSRMRRELPKEEQERLLTEVRAKAQPGIQVGPFKLPG